MNRRPKNYSVRVDGFEIDKITLSYEEYSNQARRDEIRRAIAAHHGISAWGMRLVEIGKNYIYVTNMETLETKRKEIGNEKETAGK